MVHCRAAPGLPRRRRRRPGSALCIVLTSRAARLVQNGTQHDAQGNPVINKYRFPDMAELVKYGHEAGVKMGWYQNGCACGESTEKDINYRGDIRQLAELGFGEKRLSEASLCM